MKISFEDKLRAELDNENLSTDNIEFILSLISEDKNDSNLKIMNNDVFRKLEKKGLYEAFNNACSRMKIQWTHSNEPTR